MDPGKNGNDASMVSEDQLIDELVAFDKALSEGKSTAAQSAHEHSTEQLRASFDSAFQCVSMLDQLWPAPPDDRTVHSIPGLTYGPSDDDIPAELGRFRILRKLGQGGCGIVFLAQDPLLNRLVALKVPRPEAVLSSGLRQRFLREAQAAAAIDHPNVVPVYEAAESGVLCYIASAFCPGISLREWLKKRRGKAPTGASTSGSTPTGMVPVRSAAALVATLAEAIHYTHQKGVLHRDLKPGNVMLTAPADVTAPITTLPLEVLTPRITDFGLAKVVEDKPRPHEAITHAGAVFGTPQYMAPEQARGRVDEICPATDVYALGVILFELLTGQVPFQANTDFDLLNEVVSAEPPLPAPCRTIFTATSRPSACAACTRTRRGVMRAPMNWPASCIGFWTVSPSSPGRSRRHRTHVEMVQAPSCPRGSGICQHHRLAWPGPRPLVVPGGAQSGAS